jgi:hypothetical protein
MLGRKLVQVPPCPLHEGLGVVKKAKKATITARLNVRIKFSLEQAMEAQRGSRGIALLFL